MLVSHFVVEVEDSPSYLLLRVPHNVDKVVEEELSDEYLEGQAVANSGSLGSLVIKSEACHSALVVLDHLHCTME